MHMNKDTETTRRNPPKASAAKTPRRNPPKATAAKSRDLGVRVSVLETHLQYVATKDDVRDLKDAMGDLDKKVEIRFADMDKKLEIRLAKQDRKMEARFAQLQTGIYRGALGLAVTVVVSVTVVMLRGMLGG